MGEIKRDLNADLEMAADSRRSKALADKWDYYSAEVAEHAIQRAIDAEEQLRRLHVIADERYARSCEYAAEIERLRKEATLWMSYASFLRCCVFAGENLPLDYDFKSFKEAAQHGQAES